MDMIDNPFIKYKYAIKIDGHYLKNNAMFWRYLELPDALTDDVVELTKSEMLFDSHQKARAYVDEFVERHLLVKNNSVVEIVPIWTLDEDAFDKPLEPYSKEEFE